MSNATNLMVTCPACERSFPLPEDAGEEGALGGERPCRHCGYTFLWSLQAAPLVGAHELPWRTLIDRLPLPRSVSEYTARRSIPESLVPLRFGAFPTSTRPAVPAPPEPLHLAPPLQEPPQQTIPTLSPPKLSPAARRSSSRASDWPDETSIAQRRGQEAGPPETAWGLSPSESGIEDSDVIVLSSHRAMVLESAEATSATDSAPLTQRSGSRASVVAWIVTGIAIASSLSILAWSWWPPAKSGLNSELANASSAGAASENPLEPSVEPHTLQNEWPDEFAVDPVAAWNRIGSFVVGVEYQSNGERRRMSGVLLDPRGWILLPGLTTEELETAAIWVAPSAPHLASNQSVPVQAIIARSQEPSVVLVQVDPYPFTAFTNVKLDSVADSSRRWIAVGWIEEDRWLEPLTLSRSSIDANQPLTLSDAEPTTEDSQMIDRRLLGGWVMDERGDVCGMLVPSSKTGMNGAESVLWQREPLLAWVASVTAEPRPVPIHSRVALSATASPTELNPAPDATVSPRSEATPAEPAVSALTVPLIDVNSLTRLKGLNESLIAERGEIVVDTVYLQGAELAERMQAIDQIEGATDVEPDLQLLLVDGAEPIRATWQRIAWPSDRIIAQTNEIAAKHYSDTSGFWAYGQVIEPAGVAPRIAEGDTVLMNLIGTDHQIAIPISRSFEELPIGSRWLIWGTVEPRARLGEAGSGALVIRTRYLIEEPEVLIQGRRN